MARGGQGPNLPNFPLVPHSLLSTEEVFKKYFLLYLLFFLLAWEMDMLAGALVAKLDLKRHL